MVEEVPASVQDLEWAIAMKREASQELAEARLDRVLAEADFAAAVQAHNELYREREAARAAARFERENEAKDADWEESASRLDSFADWLDDAMYNDRWYYRANDRLYEAEKAVERARFRSRENDRGLYELLKAFREGLVIDEGLTDPAWDYDSDDYYDSCCCSMCRPYLYDDYDYYDYYFQDDHWQEEERLELETERQSRLVKKQKLYKRRVLRRGRRSK